MDVQNSTDNLKERTARGLFWSVLGNGMQQVVTMLIGIALARILNVEDYGLVAMLTVFSIIAGNLQESGFTSALAIKKEARHEDFNAVFWFSIFVSASIYLVLFGVAPLIAQFNRAPELTLLGRVIFLGFFISSFGTAQAAWLFRNLMVREKTSSQVAASLLSGAVGLGCAIGGAGYWSLVAMDLAYKLTYTTMVWYWSPWRPTLAINLRPAWEMFGFGSRLLLTNVLNTINNQLLQSILGHYYNPQQVGHYSQANKWNTLGTSLLGGMINSVAQPVLAKVENDSQRQLRVFRKMLQFTSLIAFPCMMGLALIAPEFIPLAIGDKWTFCVPYLQILCAGCAFLPVNNVFTNLMISRSHSDYYLYTTGAFLVVQIGLVLGFAGSASMIPLLICIAALQPLWFLVLYGVSRRLITVSFGSVMRDVLPFFLAAVASVGLGQLLADCVVGSLLNESFSSALQLLVLLGIKMVVTAAVYLCLMWVCRVEVFRECFFFLIDKFRK